MQPEPVVLPGSECTSPAYRNILVLPPTATAAGGGTFFRSAATVGFVRFAFDPYDRKDQEGSHAFEWGAIHGRAQPPRRRIRWKFNDGAHLTHLSDAARA